MLTLRLTVKPGDELPAHSELHTGFIRIDDEARILNALVRSVPGSHCGFRQRTARRLLPGNSRLLVEKVMSSA